MPKVFTRLIENTSGVDDESNFFLGLRL